MRDIENNEKGFFENGLCSYSHYSNFASNAPGFEMLAEMVKYLKAFWQRGIKMDLLKLSEKYYDEMLQLLHDICVIPAPSGFEDERAEFVLKYLKDLGIENAHIDEAKNVVCTLGEPSDDMSVFMALTDIVFPSDVPLNYVDDGEKYIAPV